MITVVMPTMWRAQEIHQIISACMVTPAVRWIKIINNDAPAFAGAGISTWNHPKIRVFTPPQNIYITASWNQSVASSDTEFICLMNDDVVLEPHAYDFILNNWPEDAGIIGIGQSKYNTLHQMGGHYLLYPVNQRPHGWGQCMFIKREAYKPIPEDLKLWFNDDWLFKYIPGQHYQMVGPHTGRQSVTTSDPAFNEIKRQDAINWKKYE